MLSNQEKISSTLALLSLALRSGKQNSPSAVL